MKRVFLINIIFFLSTLYVCAQKTINNVAIKKCSPSLRNNIFKNNNSLNKYIIVGDSLEIILSKFKEVKILKKQSNNILIISCSDFLLKSEILFLTQVIFVDKYLEPKTEVSIIGYDRSFHGINSLDYTIPKANGKNIVISVKEKGIDKTDLDLFKRVITTSISPMVTDYHANVIASIIGGAGNSFYDGRGMANASTFLPSSFSNLFPDDINVLNQNNVTIQNHSYGTVPQQYYGAEAKSFDEQLWQNKKLVHIFSAGNRGVQAATEGPYTGITNFANLTGNFKMAKNIIAVAAVNANGVVANESSAGPTYDGRLTPQIAALGPNGTSDAAAMVSGTVAVLQQVFADSNNNQIPPANLVKALLYNTANDINRTGIDYKTGFGLLNSYEAVKLLQQKKYDIGTISNNAQWIKDIVIPINSASLKVTLTWTDSASLLNNSKALINDLDIELQEMSSGQIYRPWVLSTFASADSLNKLPIRKKDSLNTAEQISLILPNAGIYQIKVKGYNVVSTSVSFAIAYGVDTLNTFSFINPQNTSDINIQEAEYLNVKWKTFVADTNQLGNLAISYNEGNTWQNIKQGIKIHKNEYPWQIKDTSTKALFRMETSFGNFFSKNFIVSRVTKLNVDYLCADSFRLSWQKHAFATTYKIYTMIDSAYLKPILVTVDTFKIFNKNEFPNKVYAVEPLLVNGYTAARSIAIDINEQGISCFYKSLNYTLEDGNIINLSLDLSFPSLVDSVYFEEVTQSGNFIFGMGSQKVFSTSIIKSENKPIFDAGYSFYRAKIVLKSGAIIYTDIIKILTSGVQKILFYPNPATAATGLKYLLQQGIDINNSIQFFDENGRYLKGFNSIPNRIDVNIFPLGVIFYKIIDENAKQIASGKIIIK